MDYSIVRVNKKCGYGGERVTLFMEKEGSN